MTNIRAKGFESPAQLREYMAELDGEETANILAVPYDDGATRKEIFRLRQEVADMRKTITARSHRSETFSELFWSKATHQLPKVLASVATTFALSRLVRILSLERRAPPRY